MNIDNWRPAGASMLGTSQLAKSRASRRSRWDEDGDLERSALDIKKVPDDGADSRDLLLKVAEPSAQLSWVTASSPHNLVLSTTPAANVPRVQVADSRPRGSPRGIDLPTTVANRPLYVSQSMKQSGLPAAYSLTKGLNNNNKSRVLVTTEQSTASTASTASLLCSLSTKETNDKLSGTLRSVAYTLESQYDKLLEDSARKLGEAAALLYLHRQTCKFNNLLNSLDLKSESLANYSTAFTAYRTWRSSLGRIDVDEKFLMNPLATEHQEAFNTGTNSTIVQITKLALLQGGDKWLVDNILYELYEQYQQNQQSDSASYSGSELRTILTQLSPQELKLSDHDRGQLLLLVSTFAIDARNDCSE